jgi:hypothetical protein
MGCCFDAVALVGPGYQDRRSSAHDAMVSWVLFDIFLLFARSSSDIACDARFAVWISPAIAILLPLSPAYISRVSSMQESLSTGDDRQRRKIEIRPLLSERLTKM